MSTKVVIKDVIGSYVYLREARENQNGEKDYSMQIILPKNHPQVEQIKKAITEVAKEHFGEKIKLSMLKIPLRRKKKTALNTKTVTFSMRRQRNNRRL